MENSKETLSFIYRNAKAYKQSLILLSANELGVFEALHGNRASAGNLAKKIKSNTRALTLLLNALVSIGFLRKSGEYYSNIKDFEDYLIQGGKHYIGSSLKHDFNLVSSWKEIPAVVKSGRPASTERRTKKEQENFILAMANSSELRIEDFFDNVDFNSCKKFMDVGGGPGTFCLNAVKRNPEITAFNFDLPETNVIARKYLNSFKEKSRIKLVNGDYFKDDFGKDFDIILLSNIIHSLGEKDIVKLFKKSFKSISSGGKLIIKDFYIADNRIEPIRPVLFAINMLVNTKEGCAYSVKDTSRWLKTAGFTRTKYFYVNDEVEFIEAYK